MFQHVQAALRRIQEDLAHVLDAKQITAVCHEVGYGFRQRLLDPITTIHLFVIQVLNGNFAVARLQDFTEEAFSEAAYCKARGRLPLKVLQTLLQRVGAALRPTVNDSSRWRGHRTFHVDGSAFSMPDTHELQQAFGQPGGQRPGCGFPVAHLLALFHAGTGFLLNVLTAPLRTHDMAQATLLHPELEEGDVLIGDRAFCSFVHVATLWGRQVHGVFRAHQKQIVDFHPHRAYNGPGRGRRQKGRPSSRWLKRLGVRDQWVEYFKPKCGPEWMSPADYAALPASLVVRELRYQVPHGCRTRAVTLVTTLLDATLYPAKDLAALYGQRWTIEIFHPDCRSSDSLYLGGSAA